MKPPLKKSDAIVMMESVWLKKKTELLQRNLPRKIQQRMMGWIDKKDELLSRLAEYKSLKKDDDGVVLLERQALVEELDSLESDNSSLLTRHHDLQRDLLQRRSKARQLYDQLDDVKDDYLQSLATESSLNSEIDFQEAEQQRVENVLQEKLLRFDDNMITLSKLVEEIRFVSGEIEIWAEKMVALEAEVPEQYREVEFLNNQIGRARKSIAGLGDKLKYMEHNVKTSYYRIRNK